MRSQISHFKLFILKKQRRKLDSRKCDICNIDVNRASYAKHLRSKKNFEKSFEEFKLFQESIENKIKKIYNPKALQEIARETIKIDDKQFNKELAKKMISRYYFTVGAMQVGYSINLDSHHVNHAVSRKTNKPNFPDFGIELR